MVVPLDTLILFIVSSHGQFSLEPINTLSILLRPTRLKPIAFGQLHLVQLLSLRVVEIMVLERPLRHLDAVVEFLH
jgi:hypothetical protein